MAKNVNSVRYAKSNEREAEQTGRLEDSPLSATPVVSDRLPQQPIGAKTDQSGDEETPDGLNATAEATRKAAEDVPIGRDNIEPVPVFDRANLPPKV